MHRLTEGRAGIAQILTRMEIPPFDASYGWISDFLKSEKLQEKLELLQEERREVELLPISKNVFLSRLKSSHTALQQRAAERLLRYLADPSLRQNGVLDPLTRFEIRFCRPQESPFVPSWVEIEAAVKSIPDLDGISDAERSSKLATIDKKIDQLKTELPLVSPAAKAFVLWWREVQEQLCDPAGPRALSLDASPDAEKKAWKDLGLAEYVNKDSQIRPNPAD